MIRFAKSIIAVSMLTVAASTFAATAVSNNAKKADVTPEERQKIESVVYEYLITKPEVLVEAMQVLQRKQYDQAQQTVKQTQQTAGSFATALFHTPNDPMVGNPNGKVTIVEFFDYQCPHCVDMAPVMAAIVKANPDVRVIYKEFPIRGPASELAARAALAANKQGKYYVLSHAILTAGKPITEEFIYTTAKQNGIDVDKLKKDMNDKSVSDQLQANIKLAQDLKLFGTPAIFVGKTSAKNGDAVNYIPGQTDVAQLQTMIDKLK